MIKYDYVFYLLYKNFICTFKLIKLMIILFRYSKKKKNKFSIKIIILKYFLFIYNKISI